MTEAPQRGDIAVLDAPTSAPPYGSKATTALVVVALAAVGASGWVATMMSPETTRLAFDGFVRIDGVSRLFLLLINLVFLGIATYVWGRVYSTPALQDTIGHYVGFALVFMTASNLAIVSNHMLVFWLLLEASTLAAVPLIQYRGHHTSRAASWKYLLFSSVGLTLALLGLSCIGRSMELGSAQHATFFIDATGPLIRTSDDHWRRLGLVLVLLGFGTKLGLAPMYSWLPDAYDAAPPATTALLAAVQFNVALVAVLRVMQAYGMADAALVSGELVSLGLATMAVSALNVLAARNYKKLIAYAALNHAGVIAVGLAVGKDAAYGVLLYAVSNAFIKAILFLTAGKIRVHYQTEQISEVSGLIKDLPYSGSLFMIGTFALLGLPPFGSFLGELMIMSALVASSYLLVFGSFCVVLTVTFVATGRAIFPMIWGEPKKQAHWGRQPVATILPKLLFFVALVAMGLYLPDGINGLFRRAAAELGAP